MSDDRNLYVFRHSYTKKGEERGRGSDLSKEGVTLARRIGMSLGKIDYVCTSPAPRSIETAVAMGYSVDRIEGFACGYVAGEFEHHDQWGWQNPFLEFRARVLDSSSKLAALAATDAVLWQQIAEQAPPDGSSLIVAYGGSIEPVLAYCCAEEVTDAWGPPFSHGDGVHLVLCDGKFRCAALLRAHDMSNPSRQHQPVEDR